MTLLAFDPDLPRKLRVATAGIRRTMRHVRRVFYSPGDRHINATIRDCLRRRRSVEDTARALMVASDAAQLIDGRGIAR